MYTVKSPKEMDERLERMLIINLSTLMAVNKGCVSHLIKGLLSLAPAKIITSTCIHVQLNNPPCQFPTLSGIYSFKLSHWLIEMFNTLLLHIWNILFFEIFIFNLSSIDSLFLLKGISFFFQSLLLLFFNFSVNSHSDPAISS